jgi:hypothetical protein
LVLSDAELARMAQSGDGVSLCILLQRHQAPLDALALRFPGYTSEAQDALQDTFLTALRTINRLREPEAVGSRAVEHEESRRLSEARASFFESAYQQYNRQAGHDILASTFSEELVMSISTGKVSSRGYEFFVGDCEKDLEVGVKMHPTEVISSKDMAVIECDLQSPPEDPNHCPPTLSQIALYRGEKIHRLHWHFPPRPVKESYREAEWEERV